MTSKYCESYREQSRWLLMLLNRSCGTLMSYNNQCTKVMEKNCKAFLLCLKAQLFWSLLYCSNKYWLLISLDCLFSVVRVLTNRLMATMNMDGTGLKKAFGKTRLCQVMIRVGYRNPVPTWHRYLWNRYVPKPNQNTDFDASFRCHA